MLSPHLRHVVVVGAVSSQGTHSVSQRVAAGRTTLAVVVLADVYTRLPEAGGRLLEVAAGRSLRAGTGVANPQRRGCFERGLEGELAGGRVVRCSRASAGRRGGEVMDWGAKCWWQRR
jgi:hypothetical protein